MLFLIVELLVAVYVAVQRYGLEFRVSESMRNQFFRNFTTEELAQHKKIWDDMQITVSFYVTLRIKIRFHSELDIENKINLLKLS